MQSLGLEIIRQTKKEKMKMMDRKLTGIGGERVLCPFCKYESKKNKFSGVIFDDGKQRSFKCFSCGIWRRI